MRPTEPLRASRGLRARWAGLVLLAHAALWLAAGLLLRPPAPPAAAASPPALVWLLTDPSAAAARPPVPVAAGRQDSPRRPARLASPTPQPGQAWALPPLPSASPGPAAATGADPQPANPATLPPPAASRPPLAPLLLDLPRQARQAPVSPAAQAARLGTPAAPTREERLAQALGTDTALREAAHGERRRFVQGRQCVDVRPAREVGLNPFNQSAHPTPRQAEPC